MDVNGGLSEVMVVRNLYSVVTRVASVRPMPRSHNILSYFIFILFKLLYPEIQFNFK